MPLFDRLLIVVEPGGDPPGVLDQTGPLARALSPSAVRVLVVPHRGPRTADHEDSLRADVSAALPASLSARAQVSAAQGDPLDAVLRYAVRDRSDLAVIGAETAGLGRRPLATRLAMQAPCSVLTMPAGAVLALDRALIAVDFSRRSAEVLDVGTALVASAGAPACFALHVRSHPNVVRPEGFEEALLVRDQDAFALFAARVDFHGVDVQPLFEEGHDVAKTILRVAEEVDAGLIVMGTRGRTRASALLLGSEAEHVLQNTRRPVLAVKHFGSHLRLIQALLDPAFRRREGARFG